ncbi:hypothetical protein BC937DRAFT_90355 [Endogone sp. FLAS-F59071]|nr:hypothetical protein BC937DRAFT_90355 [Endogone sp. FLAS-F59071]|eukprot:RUS23236.1 hypothetical protein BC937DRAFT_90355 [Endogone sp. FLAS-F59071]
MSNSQTKLQTFGTTVRLLQDIKEFYMERPFLGLRLHFTCIIPPRYPTSPPQIMINTPIRHPNVFGSHICADILKSQTLDDKASGYVGGWTPAYTLPTVLLQLLSFFSTNKVEQEDGEFIEPSWDGQQLTFYHCKKCDYNTVDMRNEPVKVIANKRFESTDLSLQDVAPTYTLHASLPSLSPLTPTPTPTPTITTPITLLNDDCLLHLIDNFLNDQEIYIMAESYTPVRRLLKQYNTLLKRQLVCFYLRTSFRSAVLGFGIACDRKGRPLSSEFDLLSLEAFEKYKVRKSIYGQPFNQFLPLALSENHFRRALPNIKEAFNMLAGRRVHEPFDNREVLPTMCRLMNQVIVELMGKCSTRRSSRKSTSILQASEKALEGYCFFHHLLLSMTRDYPNIADQAQERLKDFLRSPERRLKKYTPDLGELLVCLTISNDNLQWEQISMPFLREMLTRNVVWLLDPGQQNKPHLAYLESSSVCEFRLRETFAGSQTSLRLLMFQTAFLRMVGRPANQSLTQVQAAYTARYGFPAAGVPAELVQTIKLINEVKQWPAFFTMIGVSVPKKESFTAFLRQMIKDSAEKKYHQCPYNQEELLRIRINAERGLPEIDAELMKAGRASTLQALPVLTKSFFVPKS